MGPQVGIRKDQKQFRNNSQLTRQLGYRQFGDHTSSKGGGSRACICRKHQVSSRKQLPQDRNVDGSSLSSKKGVCASF